MDLPTRNKLRARNLPASEPDGLYNSIVLAMRDKDRGDYNKALGKLLDSIKNAYRLLKEDKTYEGEVDSYLNEVFVPLKNECERMLNPSKEEIEELIEAINYAIYAYDEQYTITKRTRY